jgi:hypothetical protein
MKVGLLLVPPVRIAEGHLHSMWGFQRQCVRFARQKHLALHGTGTNQRSAAMVNKSAQHGRPSASAGLNR